MDVETLLKALDNENNSHLLELSNEKIRKIKVDILKELGFSQSKMREYLKSLEEYRYIDGMNELNYGCFIRWIPITDPEKLHLTKGGIFCEYKITDNGVFIVYKNFYHKHYQIKMDECLVFQKLTSQEQVLLSALDHLKK
jgi:hypothetical protein